LKTFLKEFLIAKDLDHPNVIQYKYFIKKYMPKPNKHEFHIIMELVNGDSLVKHIETKGRPKSIEIIKFLGY